MMGDQSPWQMCFFHEPVFPSEDKQITQVIVAAEVAGERPRFKSSAAPTMQTPG